MGLYAIGCARRGLCFCLSKRLDGTRTAALEWAAAFGDPQAGDSRDRSPSKLLFATLYDGA